MNQSIITAQDLSKSYGKGQGAFEALKNVNLDVRSGESIAIVGKSGSGKSTLMHLLALMDKPTKGAVLINGQPVENLSKRQQDILRNQTFGFVFQQFFLNGDASVLDNVVLPLKIAGINREERKRRGLAVLEAVELIDKANNKAKDLSGGQMQRVVVARAIINNPKIIFADEPTGNLDSTTGARVEQLLFDLNKQRDITLIIVTHDSDLAARCDRQIYIKDGSLEGATI